MFVTHKHLGNVESVSQVNAKIFTYKSETILSRQLIVTFLVN